MKWLCNIFYAGATTEETLQSAAVNEEDFDVERFDAVVIGAGAAGMFCAAMAGQAGRRVLLLDNGKAWPQDPDVWRRAMQLY